MYVGATTASITFITAFVILLVGYFTAVSSRDLVRLLISLELMFGAVFLSLVPLFSSLANSAFGIAIIAIFTSSSELLVLIASIVMFDRSKKNIYTSSITEGGDKL